MVTRDRCEREARPRPVPGRGRALGVGIARAVVVGDSVWDLLAARRARALGVGVLSGGYGHEELERAGAYRVYEEPADLLRHLDVVGVRSDGRPAPAIIRRGERMNEIDERRAPTAERLLDVRTPAGARVLALRGGRVRAALHGRGCRMA